MIFFGVTFADKIQPYISWFDSDATFIHLSFNVFSIIQSLVPYFTCATFSAKNPVVFFKSAFST